MFWAYNGSFWSVIASARLPLRKLDTRVTLTIGGNFRSELQSLKNLQRSGGPLSCAVFFVGCVSPNRFELRRLSCGIYEGVQTGPQLSSRSFAPPVSTILSLQVFSLDISFEQRLAHGLAYKNAHMREIHAFCVKFTHAGESSIGNFADFQRGMVYAIPEPSHLNAMHL